MVIIILIFKIKNIPTVRIDVIIQGLYRQQTVKELLFSLFV